MSLCQKKIQIGHNLMEAIKGAFVIMKYAGLPNIWGPFIEHDIQKIT